MQEAVIIIARHIDEARGMHGFTQPTPESVQKALDAIAALTVAGYSVQRMDIYNNPMVRSAL